MYKVIYEKRNGEIIERIRNTFPNYKVGEETSMGWIVKNILYYFNNNYYPYEEYHIISRKFFNKRKKIRLFKKYIKKYFIYLMYVPLCAFYLEMIFKK